MTWVCEETARFRGSNSAVSSLRPGRARFPPGKRARAGIGRFPGRRAPETGDSDILGIPFLRYNRVIRFRLRFDWLRWLVANRFPRGLFNRLHESLPRPMGRGGAQFGAPRSPPRYRTAHRAHPCSELEFSDACHSKQLLRGETKVDFRMGGVGFNGGNVTLSELIMTTISLITKT